MYAYIYFLNFVIEIYAFMNPSFPDINGTRTHRDRKSVVSPSRVY